jgi:hypothetical protein
LGNLVVGYTCQDHLLLDLDKTDFHRVRKIAAMIRKEWPYVGACLILNSSTLNYHLVFDGQLSWDEIVHIIQTLATLGIVQKEYATVRTFRRDLTLRVSEKRGVDRLRPVPQPVELLIKAGVARPSFGIPRYLRLLNKFIDVSQFGDIYDRIIKSDSGGSSRRRLG